MKEKKRIHRLVRFSEQYKIDPQILDNLDVFDPVLNIDTKLYLDPVLLRQSANPLFSDKALKSFNDFFIVTVK